MDADTVEAVGRQLTAKGQSLTAMVRTIDGLINSANAHWWGQGERQFVDQWRNVHRKALLRAAQAVEGLGRSAGNNAAEQRRKSSSAGHLTAASPVSSSAPRATTEYGTNHGTWREGWALAQAAYLDGKIPPGYAEVSAADLKRLGLSPSDLDDAKSGFAAKVLVDREGHFVISYRGTEGLLNAKDVGADLTGASYLSSQTEKAVYLAKVLRDAAGADNVRAVGHSLGGRLAAVAAVGAGIHSETFNAAGVSNAELTYAMVLRGDDPGLLGYAASGLAVGPVADVRHEAAVSGLIVNHVTTTDPLTAVQEFVKVNDVLDPVPNAMGAMHPHLSLRPFDHSFEGVLF